MKRVIVGAAAICCMLAALCATAGERSAASTEARIAAADAAPFN
jgi:hypothetical protein